MKLHYSIEIDAPPHQVFRWLEDPQRSQRWVPNLVEHEELQTTPERVGSTFRQVYEERGNRSEFQGEITDFERDERMTIELDGPMFGLLIEYELEDLGGQTRLTQHTNIRFRGMMRIAGLLFAPMAKFASKGHFDRSFHRLKELVESEG